ncbi:hypothetical protein SSTU70S_06966 [Stutzerimonas stutzeri]
MSLLLARRRLRATAASLLLSAADVDVRPGHRHHRLVGAVPRLPRIPRGRNLLLAVLHALRLLGSHFRQGAPLRPRCGGVEPLEHWRKPVAGGQGDEHAQPGTAKAGGDGHDQSRQREQPRQVQERRCHRPSGRAGVQPVRQRLRLHLRRRWHGLHAVSAEHARHDRLALQHPGSVLPRSAHPRPARNRYAHRPEPLGQRVSPRFCTRPTTTRAAPWSRSARATS